MILGKHLKIQNINIEPEPRDEVQACAEETDGVEGVADHFRDDPSEEQEGQPPAKPRLWHGVQDCPRDEHP